MENAAPVPVDSAVWSNNGKNPARGLIVQSDFTLLLERNCPAYPEIRDFLIPFAQLEKCPEHIHSYRLTNLSLWNAAAVGLSAEWILSGSDRYGKYPTPSAVQYGIRDTMALWGKLRLVRDGIRTMFELRDRKLRPLVLAHSDVRACLAIGDERELEGDRIPVRPESRGALKVALIKLNLPVEDLAGYTDGDYLSIPLLPSLKLRDYQQAAAHAFYLNGSERGGSGVLVLPCGAGKTVIGIDVMSRLNTKTLIICANVTAVRQWRDELLSKTELRAEDIGEYTGFAKEVRPVTIATYQILTFRPRNAVHHPHLQVFNLENWGLIIYDEVHQLPAPLFKITADIQAKRRLGLTATLVREDKREAEVFSLIGPKKSDVPWKTLEEQGWIAKASCTEIRVPLLGEELVRYESVESREQFRIAACNREKTIVVRELLAAHAGEKVLTIGLYIDQIAALARELGIPILEGKTRQRDREALYRRFKIGEINTLTVSKVANTSVDLPEATVAIQVSGTFGSRQEEAQRLGRILRPKANHNQAFFYTIVTRHSAEQHYALHRELFLLEQGYEYRVLDRSQQPTKEEIAYAPLDIAD